MSGNDLNWRQGAVCDRTGATSKNTQKYIWQIFPLEFPCCCCVMSATCADEEHVVGPLHALDLVHGDLCVAHTAFQQQGSTADHAVHQEMVLDEVEHFIRHVQGRLDTHLPGVAGHALRWSKLEMKNESLRNTNIQWERYVGRWPGLEHNVWGKTKIKYSEYLVSF